MKKKFLKNLKELTGAKKIGFGSPRKARYQGFKIFFFSFIDNEKKASIKFACSLNPMPILAKTVAIRKEKIEMTKEKTFSLFQKVFGRNVYLTYTDKYVTVTRFLENKPQVRFIKYTDDANLIFQLKNMFKMKKQGFELKFHNPLEDRTVRAFKIPKKKKWARVED
jgi:hypothetical protein